MSELIKISAVVCLLVMPILGTVFSVLFLLGYPKKKNRDFGYRSGRSMGSEEAWALAQHVMKIFFIVYTAILWVVTAALFVLVPFARTTGGSLAVLGIEAAALFLLIPINELVLKKRGH